MGRFYWGDIKGKFWFGVQDSDDVENLVNIQPPPQSFFNSKINISNITFFFFRM